MLGHSSLVIRFVYFIFGDLSKRNISQTHSLNILDETPCNEKNPCQNGGTCSGTVFSYHCVCPNGYTGNNCESKIGVVPVSIALMFASSLFYT